MSTGMSFKLFVLIIISLPLCLCTKNFSGYWNLFTGHCKRDIGPLLTKYEFIQNAGHEFRGERIALFYEFTHGRYPYFKNYSIDDPIYGGTPQNITPDDIDMHLNVSKWNISKYINESSSGLGVLDFEEWRPVYELNVNRKVVYIKAAINITRNRYPTLTDVEVNNTAVKEYNKTARDFLEKSLLDARRYRNKTLWGLYGFPYCNYNAGTKNESRCLETYQKHNDRMQYIFDASQALYPSIYLDNRTDPARNFRYVHAIVTEAQRIAHKYNSVLPIYVYTKIEYDPRKKFCDFYTAEDLCSTVVLPYVMGVDGLIFWSSSNNMTERCSIVTTFANTTLGPLYKEVVSGRYGNSTAYNATAEFVYKDVCKSEYIANITKYIELFNDTTSQQCETFLSSKKKT